MSSALLTIGALILLALGYYFYGRFIERRVVEPEPDAQTPACAASAHRTRARLNRKGPSLLRHETGQNDKARNSTRVARRAFRSFGFSWPGAGTPP